MTRTEPIGGDAATASQAAGLFAVLEAMEATLAVAEALVLERRRIDLAGLEDEIGRLCMACLAAPAAATGRVRARLEALVAAIDRLQAGLTCP